nr:hypothetical protein [Thioalkalivibrio sp. ALE28]
MYHRVCAQYQTPLLQVRVDPVEDHLEEQDLSMVAEDKARYSAQGGAS